MLIPSRLSGAWPPGKKGPNKWAASRQALRNLAPSDILPTGLQSPPKTGISDNSTRLRIRDGVEQEGHDVHVSDGLFVFS